MWLYWSRTRFAAVRENTYLDRKSYILFLVQSALLSSMLPGHGRVSRLLKHATGLVYFGTVLAGLSDCRKSSSCRLTAEPHRDFNTSVKCRPRLRNFYQKLMLAADEAALVWLLLPWADQAHASSRMPQSWRGMVLRFKGLPASSGPTTTKRVEAFARYPVKTGCFVASSCLWSKGLNFQALRNNAGARSPLALAPLGQGSAF